VTASLPLLVWRNVCARPVRSALLFGFVAISLFLFVFLRSVLTTLDDVIHAASPRRLTVQSGVGLFAELPTSYAETLRELDGVEDVCRTSWFGGVYRDPSQAFPSMAVDLEPFLRMYPEVRIAPEERTALLEDGRGCLIGRQLAERHGLALGSPLPLLGTLYPRPDGSAWDFVVRAIYRSEDPAFPETLHLFHWAYLDEARRDAADLAGTDEASQVTAFLLLLESRRDSAVVAEEVDARYADGPQRTHTQTEAAHRAEEVAMLGDLPRYLRVVAGTALVAVLLAVVNAMAIAGRARAEQVGVLKALGFRDPAAARLVLLESLVVVGAGGAAGTLVAVVSESAWRHVLGATFSFYTVRVDTVVLAALASVAIALAGALPPALRLARARPLDVLRLEA
jgi:putative ABC transport system permease protein